MKTNWKGVFPALTTQFRPDQSLDLAATAKHLDAMIEAGIHGVIMLGTRRRELLARIRREARQS